MVCSMEADTNRRAPSRVHDDLPRLFARRDPYGHPPLVRSVALTEIRAYQRTSRFFANRALLSPPSHSAHSDSGVEWAYAFDVHTNAFFPFYLTLYLAQLFLLPVVLKTNWVCLWVGNTLYLAA
jgi:hypothetical protein